MRLGLAGVAAGAATGLVWRAARARWGAAPFVLAVLAVAGLTGRLSSPRWSGAAVVGALVAALAGAGAMRLLADPAIHWTWVAAGALLSSAGVWAGVPETGPALLVGGALCGLAAISALTGARWKPSAGVGLAAALGWAALTGAAGRPWAALGGVLCTGVAPWVGLRLRRSRRRRRVKPRPWLLGAHLALVIVAARWIGVDPDAGWVRVAVLAVAGGAVARAYRPRA
ncbi:MAG: hypothetical protein AB1679_05265 [Actinomycetota bacterium]